MTELDTMAVLMEAPGKLGFRRLGLLPCSATDIVVDIAFSGISTGTERLLWSGRMPPFPGMGYPLVPGYESVGIVAAAGAEAAHRVGETVFVPGATCFKDARGLFGGAAQRLIVAESRAIRLPDGLGERGVLIALAATARHAIAGGRAPELIVGHGVLGRLLARQTIAAGHPPPVVWESNAERRNGGTGYPVIDPSTDDRRDYHAIYDVSGDATILDTLIGRAAKGGEIVLAGFYEGRPSFAFPPAFMREVRIRIAAEWQPLDLVAILADIEHGVLDLSGLITHHHSADEAETAYRIAFSDAQCLKMIIDWRGCA